MLTYNPPHRIPIAAAAEVAARLPGTRYQGDGYRTRGYCHGSGDKPTSASLVFSDPPRPGEQSLHVHCFKCSPQHAGRVRRHPPRPAKSDRSAAMQVSRLLAGSPRRAAVHHNTSGPGAGYDTARDATPRKERHDSLRRPTVGRSPSIHFRAGRTTSRRPLVGRTHTPDPLARRPSAARNSPLACPQPPHIPPRTTG